LRGGGRAACACLLRPEAQLCCELAALAPERCKPTALEPAALAPERCEPAALAPATLTPGRGALDVYSLYQNVYALLRAESSSERSAAAILIKA
jgi:hypothetical protein